MEDINYFTQLCLWPSTIVGEDSKDEFIQHMKNEFNVRVKYACEVLTLPDLDGGNPISDTGGRNDLLFYIHSDDIGRFATRRLGHGIRWWEDVIKYNDNTHLYTKELLKEYPPTW